MSRVHVVVLRSLKEGAKMFETHGRITIDFVINSMLWVGLVNDKAHLRCSLIL